MRIINLAIKDWMQIVRDWKSALFLVAMPIAFTLFFGTVVTGTVNGDPGERRLPVGWVDHDAGGLLGRRLLGMVETSGALRPVVLLNDAEADTQVRDEKLAAAMVVPQGFSERAMAGETTTLPVITVPGSLAGQMAEIALQSIVARLLGAQQAARLSSSAYLATGTFDGDAAQRAYFDEAITRANAAWQDPPLTVATVPINESTTGAFPVNGYLQASPGMIVQFAIFSLVTTAMVLVLERKTKTHERLLTTPIRPAEIIGGHLLSMFSVGFAQELLLVGLGQALFGVNYLREPLGTLLMMAALAVWVAALGLLISAMSKTPERVIAWSLIAMFLFASLGGAWFPLEVAGETFAVIGHLTPAAWAMDGFQNIVLRGLDTGTTLAPAGGLVLCAAAFGGLAALRLRP